MNTATPSSLPSLGMQALIEVFNDLKPPYRQGDVVRFNLAYLRLYPKLGRSEKPRAEALATALLNNLEDERLASNVFLVF